MKHTYGMWLGRSMLGLFAAFMLFASVTPKLLGLDVAGDTLQDLGWSRDYALPIGLLELTLVFLVLVPQTRVVGAVLMTALLGGAVATHLRVGSPLFSHVLFGVYLGLIMWGGIWFLDPKLRQQMPLREVS